MQGKGLYAKKFIKEGEVIFTEKPLVCAQFSWNELYKYTACDFCLRSLESAEEMGRRLSNNGTLVLPHPECCKVEKNNHVSCPQCQVSPCHLSNQSNTLCKTKLIMQRSLAEVLSTHFGNSV